MHRHISMNPCDPQPKKQNWTGKVKNDRKNEKERKMVSLLKVNEVSRFLIAVLSNNSSVGKFTIMRYKPEQSVYQDHT